MMRLGWFPLLILLSGVTGVQIDVDIGSSSVARSVIGLVLGYVTSIVVDLAILIEVSTPILFCFRCRSVNRKFTCIHVLQMRLKVCWAGCYCTVTTPICYCMFIFKFILAGEGRKGIGGIHSWEYKSSPLET